MKQHFGIKNSATVASSLILASLAVLTNPAQAQDYTLIDLSAGAGNSVATKITDGVAVGYVSPGIFGTAYRATLWDGAGQLDLHPSALVDDPATGAVGHSFIQGGAAGIQVGWASGLVTAGRSAPVVWNNTAESAAFLSIPFVNFGGQAQATDGSQIVGYATAQDRDGTTIGPAQAMVWDATTGAGVSLGDGGNPSIAYGVGGGVQVGYVNKSQATATLWRGTRQSQVSLHPKNAVVSVANATDGARQVGYAGFDIRVRQEAAKGNKDKRFNFAHVWTDTASSALNIHSYFPLNAPTGVNLTQSYALGIQGSWIVGYAGDELKFGTPAYSHAIVWDANFQAIDLNGYLAEGFVGAQATSVDADGNVSGFIAKADGTRHAAVWLRTATE
ncbi:MAG: hypothetical protein IT581_10700 [Verrucomicrobiales bacterium]|nr:hypothetical protein [Verrucomicrobiales bacterium]